LRCLSDYSICVRVKCMEQHSSCVEMEGTDAPEVLESHWAMWILR